MPHQVGKQRNIIKAIKKILCKTVAKGVRINNLSFQSVLISEMFQLLGDAARCYAVAKTIQEDITARNAV